MTETIYINDVISAIPCIKAINFSVPDGIGIEFIDDGNTYVINPLVEKCIMRVTVDMFNELPEEISSKPDEVLRAVSDLFLGPKFESTTEIMDTYSHLLNYKLDTETIND